MPEHALTLPASIIRSGPLPGDDTAVPTRIGAVGPGRGRGRPPRAPR